METVYLNNFEDESDGTLLEEFCTSNSDILRERCKPIYFEGDFDNDNICDDSAEIAYLGDHKYQVSITYYNWLKIERANPEIFNSYEEAYDSIRFNIKVDNLWQAFSNGFNRGLKSSLSD